MTSGEKVVAVWLVGLWGWACTNGAAGNCPSDQVSVNGECRGACNNSRDCPAAQECDPSVGACVPRSTASGSSSTDTSAGAVSSSASGPRVSSSASRSSSVMGSSRPGTDSSGSAVVSSSTPPSSGGPTGPVCDVDGSLVPAGTGHPQNPCLVCDPLRDPGAWSAVDNGSSCGPGRVCVGVACTQGCFVDGAFHARDGAAPNNPCATCQPSVSTTAFTALMDGTTCGNGQSCASGVCGTGCTVDSMSVPSGQANPQNPCESCQPGVATTSWTPRADTTRCDADGTVCNGVQRCSGGTCVAAEPARTCDAPSTCQQAAGATCDAVSGVCTYPLATDGTTCGAGQVCSAGACRAGCVVGGVFHTPGTADPTEPCRTCQPAVSTTAFSPVAGGTSCDDGDLCNGVRACVAGVCTLQTPAVTCTPGPCQTGGVCNGQTGQCSFGNADNGMQCGNGQVCQNGMCGMGCVVGGQSFSSGMLNPTNPCQSCQPGVSTSAFTPRGNGVACEDDGDVCNGTRSCQGGACTPAGAPITCTPGACQTGGTCNATTGACSFGTAPNGTGCGAGQVCFAGSCGSGCVIDGVFRASGAVNPVNPCQVCTPSQNTGAWSARTNGTGCDDGDVCNGVSTCQGGSCVETTGDITCTPGTCQMGGTCNATTGACSFGAAPNGSNCGSGQVCFGGTCGSGCVIDSVFRASGAVNPGNPCQVCSPGQSTTAWSNRAEGTNCDDGNVCNGGNTCQDGMCRAAAPPVTCTPAACQTSPMCNPTSGACTYANAANGTPCQTARVCVGGACNNGCWIANAYVAAGEPRPGNACQYCDPSTSVTAWSDRTQGSDCSTGNLCDGTRTCQSGACQQASPPVTCTPGVCQTGGTCTPANGQCVFGTAADGTACNPGQLCHQGACVTGCYVDGAFWNAGDQKPGEPCLRCVPATATNAWTAFTGESTDCPLSQVCHAGSCRVGCIIAGGFHPEDGQNPANECQVCRPTFNTSDWSNASGFLCQLPPPMSGTGQCCSSTCQNIMEICADQ